MLIQIPKQFKSLVHAANWTFGEYFEKAGGKAREDFQCNTECLISGEGALKGFGPDEKHLAFLQELLSHLIELEQSFLALADCAHLYRSSPKLPKGVSIFRFRKLLLEAHLEELYVFTNRINSCVTFLQRAYACDHEFEKVAALGSQLKDLVNKQFRDLVLIRGAHTHRVRLSHILQDYRRILFLEGLSNSSSDPAIERILCDARRRFHQDARRKLNAFTLGAKDALLGMVEFLVCYLDADGSFRIPHRYTPKLRDERRNR